jgi:membrane protease YdiL (CAAX protease family)
VHSHLRTFALIDIPRSNCYDRAVNSSPPGDLPSAGESPSVQPVPRGRWWIYLVLLAGYVLVLGVIGLNRGAHQAPALSRTSQGLLMMAGVELSIFGIVLGLAWLISRPSLDDLLLRPRGGFRIVPLGIGYSVALRLMLAFVVLIISAGLVASGAMSLESLQEFFRAHQPRTETIVDASAMRSDPVYFLLMLTVISFIVAGLREELWRAAFLAGLRAVAPRHFGSVKGQIAAVAIAAVVFGLGHLAMGLLAAVMAGLLGFGLGAIMVLHRSIWPAVIAHGMFDATTFALLPWIQR